MADTTDIINVALRKIGAKTVSSRLAGDKNANVANDIYDGVLEACLRSSPWNFATARAKLARSSETPVYGYNYAYVLPADWVRTISAHDNDSGYASMDHKVEQQDGARVIMADEEDVYLRYVRLEDDPNLMTSDFRYALSLWLAMDMAIPIANSRLLMRELRDELRVGMAKARATDAIGMPAARRPQGTWAGVRGGQRQFWPR